MAWVYSKRVKVAPDTYITITKNGISNSIGIRSSSTTFGQSGNYVNTGIPGTGFYSRQASGGKPTTPKVKYAITPTPIIHSKSAYTFVGILCLIGALTCLAAAPAGLIGTLILAGGVWANFSNRHKYYGKNPTAECEAPSFLTEAQAALSASTDRRHQRILKNFITTFDTIDSIEDEDRIIAVLNKKPKHNADLISSHSSRLTYLRNKLASTEYNVDADTPADTLHLYEHVCRSFEKLLTSQKIWIQTLKVHNTVAKSSVGSLVDLKPTSFGVGVFNYIKSKFDVPVLPIGDQLLYLYPEFAILSKTPSQFEVIDYDKISIIYSAIRFQEPGAFPSDAERIGSTWLYVNKDGGPDKRFANNPQIAVVKYGGIRISIKGLQPISFQISNADFAENFCTAYRRLASATQSDATTPPAAKPQPTIPEITPTTTGTLADVIQASDKLFQCLIDMSADKQVIEALNRQHQLDVARDKELGGDRIDNRLAFVAVSDLIKCFEGFGHRPDMSTDEGRAIGIILSRLLIPDNGIWNNETMMRRPEGKKLLEDSYYMFKNNLQVEFDPNKFLLIEMLRHEGVDEETINRWAVLLYRFALLIAKADGHLSDTEQKWLTNILSFTQNGSVTTTTKYRNSTKKLSIPPVTDTLFEDAARLAVESNTLSASSIQRKYSIGYNRASKILDQLEAAGIISPASGTKPRKVLIDTCTLDELLSRGSTTIEIIEEIPNDANVATSPRKAQGRIISNPMKELENLIGLSSVKTEISNIYNLIRVQKLRTSKGLSVPDISYHCVFTGNPGTGKTTVARLVAQIYKSLGILTKGHLIETDRSGLVAEYVGQTAVKTNKIIDSALDGVLFIDEAYSLVQNGGQNDFGLEAIATLLKRMEDNRSRLVVILAGYSDEMKQFIDSNPGLQSRFSRYIHFEDYSADELSSIYEFNLAKFDYRMTPGASAAIKEVMAEAVRRKDKNFGNARFVRNLFEKTLERQAKRLAASALSTLSEDALTEITESDINEV